MIGRPAPGTVSRIAPGSVEPACPVAARYGPDKGPMPPSAHGRSTRRAGHSRPAPSPRLAPDPTWPPRPGVSQQLISSIERGHVDTIAQSHAPPDPRSARRPMRDRRALAGRNSRSDARRRPCSADRGDRSLNCEQVGWLWAVEVTYSIFGERGSIDVLAFHRPTGSLLVIEVKTELTSIEETLRRHHAKVRLAARIAREQCEWQSTSTSRLLVLPESSTTRDRIARHARVLDSVLPAENVAVRRWLAAPSGPMQGRLFLPITSPRGRKQGLQGPHRVRRPDPSPNRARPGTPTLTNLRSHSPSRH